MNCDRCGDEIETGEAREHHGQTLCEDCYMDALSPARTCDPWAVHSAKSFVEGEGPSLQLNPLQTRIIEILEETGGVELPVLAERLQVKPSDIQREIAALRHMEKVRGALVDGIRIICLW